MNAACGLTNYNDERGRRFGVFSLGHHEWLHEEFLNGTDCRYEGLVEDIRAAVDGIDCLDGCDEIKTGIVDFIMEEINSNDLYNSDEAPMRLTASDGSSLLLDYLGGSPLVWVIDSDWITAASNCSPCVPGAGDLDNPTGRGLRGSTLCMSPEEMAEISKGNGKEYFVSKIDKHGNLSGELWHVKNGKAKKLLPKHKKGGESNGNQK